MNFKKVIVSLFAAVVVLATPAVAANAKGLPNKNSNYWNQSRSIKTTRTITAYEHSVSNNTLSNTVLKKKTIKKGTALTVSRINNNHKEWLLSGIKSSNGAVWITKQSTTTWMKTYVDPSFSTKYVKTTKNIKVSAHKVANGVIQSKVTKTATIKKGTALFTRKLSNNAGWIVYGNVPNYNGVWVYGSTKANWMKAAKVYKTGFSTVDSDKLPDSGYVTGYYSYYLGSITLGGTTIYPGDQIRVQKTSDSTESIMINGLSNGVNVGNNQGLATLTNTVVIKLKDSSGKETGQSRIVARYTPDDARNIVLKGYTPQNGDQWTSFRSDHQTYDVYVYYTSINGWVYQGPWDPNKTQSNSNQGNSNANSNQSTNTNNK
ncbi:MAG: hypothetical protein M3Z82_01925 [Apilactobacillus sp.]|uniref:hypothetical protein n=1 Tax=Apilactobacillus apinorum TaxID=1218495 RepID=UPI0030EAF8FB|nr:hypothetical protein [Apilactobacillus sp.]